MPSQSGFFGLTDVKLALWATGDTYGAKVDLLGARMFGFQEEVTSAMHDGDDTRISIHTQPIGGSVDMEFLFNDISVYGILTGRDAASSGSDIVLALAKGQYPYFGLGAVIAAAEGTSQALEIWMPKAKMTTGFQLQAQFGQFLVPRVTVQLAYANATWGYGMIINRLSATTAVANLPPQFT